MGNPLFNEKLADLTNTRVKLTERVMQAEKEAKKAKAEARRAAKNKKREAAGGATDN